MSTIRIASDGVRERVDRVDREQPVDEEADQDRVRDGSRADACPESPRDDEHDHADHDVRRPEGQRGLVRDPLREDVPR